MLVSVNWLKDYVDIDEDVEQLAERLTMSGSNVEGIEYIGKEIEKVVIGQVLKVEDHPNADKLVVCQVTTGDDNYQIITGATNVKEKDKVPVALPGSVISGGQKLKTAKLRGLPSYGMLCSAQELGLDEHGLPEEMKDGILILPQDAPLGTDVKEYLGLEDAVIDFEITPNRPDCLSIVGIARETAVTFNRTFTLPKVVLQEDADKDVDEKVQVQIKDTDLCSRYVAKLICDVKIEPSPLWMQRRLQVCGVRPINNIVDITNYVMLELGQPLHAFDFNELNEGTIVVRRANNGENIVTLDGVTRELNEDMLIIADTKEPIAIAGVMGGEKTEISSSTQMILLESANFSGPCVRRTSRKLGLRSEASSRFEKGIDPNLCLLAANRACQLIEQLGAGKVLNGSVDVFPKKPCPKKVYFRPEKINKTLGIDVLQDDMIDILNRLELKVEQDDKGFFVNVPTFRADIEKEADIAEEIARIYGYDKLEATLPEANTTLGRLSREQKLLDEVKQALVYQGYSEIYTYSFMSPNVFNKINIPEESPLRKAITLMNPLGEEHSIMRTTLIPSMLEVVLRNINQNIKDVRLFEIAAAYIPKQLPLKELPLENKRICISLSGKDADFFNLKRAIEVMLASIKVSGYTFERHQNNTFHPGRCAKILLEGKDVGIIGELHPDVLENYEIDKKVYIAEMDLDLLFKHSSRTIKFSPLPKFPATERDLALIVKDDVPAGHIIETIKEIGGQLLEKVELFDIYKGDQIPEGCKSIAFSLTFRDMKKTLTDTEVNNLHEKIKSRLAKKFKGDLRE